LGVIILTGIFGTGALIQADINLILQIVTFVIIGFSLFYKSKNKFKLHGKLMGSAIILHILSFLTIMGPVFFTDLDGFVNYISYLEVQTMWIHAIPGTISMISGTIIVVAWALQPTNIISCRRKKRLMDVTTLFWLISLIFGIVTYVLFYV